ncbi:MAG TPA: hypothetical protein GX507_03770, partial [Clostridia bacterium]|nr:hypothetical protein [Clostridia bacterium]
MSEMPKNPRIKDTEEYRKNVFLTGPRSAGKTTLLFRTLRNLRATYGGFVVKEIYEHGARTGLVMIDLGTGERGKLARYVDGKPRVNIEVFEGLGVRSVRRAVEGAPLVVLDELGRFEIEAPTFMEAVFDALSSEVPVLGVLKAESNPFLDAIRRRSDVKLITVNPSNRSVSKEILLRYLSYWYYP